MLRTTRTAATILSLSLALSSLPLPALSAVVARAAAAKAASLPGLPALPIGAAATNLGAAGLEVPGLRANFNAPLATPLLAPAPGLAVENAPVAAAIPAPEGFGLPETGKEADLARAILANMARDPRIRSVRLPNGVKVGREYFDGAAAGKNKRDAAAVEAPKPAPRPKSGPAEGYRRADIARARFGEAERQALIKKARTLKSMVDRKIMGQGRATKIVQDRLVQYFEGFGTRKKDPVAAHLIGLPGIGKTAILDAVAELGFTVERIDVQKYVNGSPTAGEYVSDLETLEKKNRGKPFILLIDELDKLPEILEGREETTPFIGALNQILTDGIIRTRYGTLDLSNAMVMTTMNFSPAEIETFSASALKTPKKYYDFTIEDFAAFDAWIQEDPSARYKLLSHLFRANTVSRLAPNTVIMKPLSADDYAVIVKLTADAAVARAVGGANAKKRLEVSHTEAFEEFLRRNTIFPPSGARETIAKADALVEELIYFGTKATLKGDRSLDRPRKLLLDFNKETGQAKITVTSRVLRRGQLEDGPAFVLKAAYDPGARVFSQPEGLAADPPPAPELAAKEKGPTQKQILAARFPKTQKLTAGLADKINVSLVGQDVHARLVEKEFNAYLNRKGPVVNQPPFLVFAGFPGIGKSELANLTAANLGLPIVRINMQGFTSDSPQALANFGRSLSDAVEKAKNGPNDKYIILFEELDKVFEIDAMGRLVNRPIMAIMKDLLQDGVVSIPAKSDYGSDYIIDIRDAFSVVTMNFAGDRFGFEADPRLTTIGDTLQAARKLAMTPAALKKLLGSMFLPETVSRLMSRFYIMNPLNESDYKRLIAIQAGKVVKSRLTDPGTGKNLSRLAIELTPAYQRYLFNETVIPSEGARHTVLATQNRITAHLEAALARIPKSSPLATRPAVLVLDFKPGKSEVVAVLKPESDSAAKPLVVYRKEIALTFPPLAASGRMPARRIKTAAHEFGHAYTAVRLGLRFEYATAVPPKAGVGGYVKYQEQSQTARSMLAYLYSTLGSRALERIFLSRDPRGALSVLDVTPGPANDILQATQMLWNAIYELGFDPQGGTFDRRGFEGMNRYATFADLPPETVERLGRILRRMENHLVDDLLQAHDQSWYQDKIVRFARAGGISEREFYKMIGYPHPGRNNAFLGEQSRIEEIFADQVEKPLPEVAAAKSFKQGRTATTAAENLDAFLREFVKLVQEELHPAAPAK
ncbi:MAG: AAA family ATPase [Elusimicrobia bacterium]|nr:AAA family ATPase [Elusimicrobiota bacterium]